MVFWCDTPFGDEDGDLLRVLHETGHQTSVTAAVEVEGIHDIVWHGNRVGGSLVDVLRPGGGACDDDRLRVDLTNSRNDSVVIALDSGPLHTVGLVGKLVQDMFFVLVQACHFSPESESVGVAWLSKPVVGVARS